MANFVGTVILEHHKPRKVPINALTVQIAETVTLRVNSRGNRPNSAWLEPGTADSQDGSDRK
jgi:hypothetical protein